MAFRPEAQTHALDWPVIERYLAVHNLRMEPGIAPRQLGGGLANLNFLVRINNVWMVLRRPPNGPLPPGANDMQREHRILSRLWRTFALAPRSHHFCDDVQVAGAPFLLIDYRAGLSLRGDNLQPLAPIESVGLQLTNMLVDTLAQLHAVDLASVGLEELGRPEGFFRRTAQGWILRAQLVGNGSLGRSAQAVADWLTQVADPKPTTPVLLHNDFKLDNILLDPRTLEPRAIVDWDMGTRGDALFDLATLLSYWSEPDDPSCMRRLAQMPTLQPGFATREEVAIAYANATGRAIDELKPYRVLTMFKLAVVFQQLHQRHLVGEALDPRYAHFGQLADELFEFTLDISNNKFF
ncbi:aminoglycoside phosphotransferase [Pseudomonas syringae]|uniref:Aminoglycoside phosphotransferase n=1 Tax=Pseudomonas syringae TaxID=317 RepID=A0A085V8J1_PSESX|nr:aminoglycoside phosphotransferase [Pseudomonas syringae]